MKNKMITAWLLMIILLAGCKPGLSEDPLVIAISKASPIESYGNYIRWLKSVDSGVICLDMYNTTLDSALLMLESCSGLLLSGGPDVFPGRYEKATDSLRCGIIDFKRDSLEVALIEAAMANEMPVLGICRGEQLLNVYLGGSLVIDIPSHYDTTIVHRCDDYLNCFHNVNVEKNSLLYKITGTKHGTVTTNHHQAADRIASGLKVSARSDDGLVEAIEYENPADHAFLLGVQWHPERMTPDNKLSLPIAERFLQECIKYRLELKH